MFMLIVMLCAGILDLILAAIVWKKNKKNLLNKIFIIITIFIAIWIFLNFLFQLTYNLSIIIHFYAIGALIISSLLLFTYCFIDVKLSKKKIILIILPGMAFFILSYINGFIILSVKHAYTTGYDAHPGRLFFAYGIFIIISTILILYKFYSKYKNFSVIKKSQAKYMILGIAGFGIFTSIVSFILPFFQIWSFTSLDTISSLFFTISITYAITKYRFMDISVIIRRTTVYFFTILSYLSVLLLAIYITAIVGDITVHWTIVWMAFCVAAILLTLFDKIKLFFTKLANSYFFSDIVDYQKTITDLAKLLPQEIKLSRVVDLIVNNLMDAMKLNRAGVLLLDNKTSKYKIIKTIGFNEKNGISLISNTFLINYLKNHKQLVAAQELEFLKEAAKTKKEETELEKLAKDMNHIEAGLCLPLFSANNLIGVIILGNKISGDAYSKEDLEMLEIVTNQASIAIENARLYKEVQDFNKNLQKKVDKQTKDIKNKTKRLRKLLTMRSEFLNITSHQLRTPVSVIKGILSMIKEGSIPKEREKEFLDSAFQRTVKLNEIINDILDASAIDSGKFEIQFSPISIGPILKEIYQEKNQDNLDLSKKIKLILDLPKKSPPDVWSNEKYLRHTLLNLINNAFQYTIKGSIIIKVETKKDKVVIKIIDTGIGIHKDDLPKLFQKFGRAKNAISTYTDGSGLGLFIIKKIINEHQGAKVYIKKTKINKGSTFVLELPMAQ